MNPDTTQPSRRSRHEFPSSPARGALRALDTPSTTASEVGTNCVMTRESTRLESHHAGPREAYFGGDHSDLARHVRLLSAGAGRVRGRGLSDPDRCGPYRLAELAARLGRGEPRLDRRFVRGSRHRRAAARGTVARLVQPAVVAGGLLVRVRIAHPASRELDSSSARGAGPDALRSSHARAMDGQRTRLGGRDRVRAAVLAAPSEPLERRDRGLARRRARTGDRHRWGRGLHARSAGAPVRVRRTGGTERDSDRNVFRAVDVLAADPGDRRVRLRAPLSAGSRAPADRGHYAARLRGSDHARGALALCVVGLADLAGLRAQPRGARRRSERADGLRVHAREARCTAPARELVRDRRPGLRHRRHSDSGRASARVDRGASGSAPVGVARRGVVRRDRLHGLAARPRPCPSRGLDPRASVVPGGGRDVGRARGGLHLALRNSAHDSADRDRTPGSRSSLMPMAGRGCAPPVQ